MLTYYSTGYIIVFVVEYLRRPNGEEPALEWINSLQQHQQTVILAKIDKLEEEGLKLLATGMMRPIKGRSNIYELRGGQCRIILYHEIILDRFLLLYGFLKKRQVERGEILTACSLLDEYISNL